MKKGKKRIGLLTGIRMVSLALPAAPAMGEADACRTALAGMTTAQKVAQMIMPSFRYHTDENGDRQPVTEMRDDIRTLLEKYGFAGVIFFAQNAGDTAQAARLVDAMQRAAAAGGHPQLLTAIDQEGGGVTRLGKGTQMPGNMALGAVNDLAVTEAVARLMGEELAAIGFNYDAAPVVDVNNNPANPVIGIRSFSDDPGTVAAQGASFMKGLRSAGVISTLKHFPGHGDTDTDSHTGLPCVDKGYEALKAFELVPFQACIDAGAEAVMTAHIQYPQLERETYTSVETGEAVHLPATLSRTILTDVLRMAHACGAKVVLISAQLSYDAARYPDADAVVIAWCARGMSEDPRRAENGVAQYGPNLPAALCSLLTGGDFRGTLPIDIPAMDAAGRFTDGILYRRGSGIVPESRG